MTSPAPTDDGSHEQGGCPPWCDHGHDPSQANGRRHRRAVGEFWQREHRTNAGRITRRAGGLVSVNISVDEHDGALDEEVVEISLLQNARAELMTLTNGEARRLLAMLEAAVATLDQLLA